MPRLALMLLLLPIAVHADTLVLANGTTMEGIAREDGDSIELRIPQGSIYFPKNVVARVEKKTSPLEQYETQKARMAAGDAKGHLDLAVFCEAHNLKPQASDELHEVIGIDPENSEARRRMGYSKVDGVWMTREEQFKAMGLVEEHGEWMTPGAAAMLRTVEGSLVRLESRLNDLERQNGDLRRDVQDARLSRIEARLAASPQVAACQANTPASYAPYYSPCNSPFLSWGGYWSPSYVVRTSIAPRGGSAGGHFQSHAGSSGWGISGRYPFGGPR